MRITISVIDLSGKKSTQKLIIYILSYFFKGKSFSEALILESVNPQYDKRLFIEVPENKSLEDVVYKNCFECQNKKTFLYTKCPKLVFFGELNEQSLSYYLWVN